MDDHHIGVIERPVGRLLVAASSNVYRISLRWAAHGRPIAMTLWHSPSEGTRFESTMQDLVGRLEAGVLTVSQVGAPAPDESFTPVPPNWSPPLSVEVLVLNESGFEVESGVTLQSASGTGLTIIAGAQPCTIALLGLEGAPHLFEPEYELSVYHRRPLSAK